MKFQLKEEEILFELVNIKGQDYLFYPAFPIHVAMIRGTYADESGNISFEKEVSPRVPAIPRVEVGRCPVNRLIFCVVH